MTKAKIKFFVEKCAHCSYIVRQMNFDANGNTIHMGIIGYAQTRAEANELKKQARADWLG